MILIVSKIHHRIRNPIMSRASLNATRVERERLVVSNKDCRNGGGIGTKMSLDTPLNALDHYDLSLCHWIAKHPIE